MRGICYLREISDLSLADQQRAYLGFCAAEGLEVGPTITEEPDASDSSAPQFGRLLSSLCSVSATDRGSERRSRRPRSFVVAFVADLRVLGDRVSTQARRALQLEAIGAHLRLGDGADLDEALAQAWAGRAPVERRRERVRQAMRRRALRGEVLGRPPYGYRVVDRHLASDPEEAPVVREMYRLALDEDLGVRRIAQRFNAQGYRTRKQAPWSMVTIRSMLRNPVYTGTYRRLDVVVPGAHEALVSAARFASVQRRLDRRRTPPGERHRHRYLLAGIARCGHCGNRLIGATRRRRGARRSNDGSDLTYYQCESRANTSTCAYHSRRADDLEREVRRLLQSHDVDGILHQDDNTPAADRAPVAPVGERSQAGLSEDRLRRKAARIRSRRRSLRRDLDRLMEQRASGQATADQFRRASASVVLEDFEAELQSTQLASQAAHRQQAGDRFRVLAEARSTLVASWDATNFDERRRLLSEVVYEVVVTDDGVRIELER